LSLSGRWAMEVAVRRPDAFDAFARFETDVSTSGAQQVNNAPGAFRFRWPMLSGVLVALIGVLLGVVVWRTLRAPGRVRLALAPVLALALIVPGGYVVLQGFQTTP